MNARTLPLVLVLAVFALFTAGCGDGHPVSATQIVTSGPSITLKPATLTAQAVIGGNCPAVTPFNVIFHVLVGTTGTSLTVTNIDAGFTDTRGVSATQVTLPGPIPITPFGTALAQARAQDFPVVVPVGCGTDTIGTVTVMVTTQDQLGRAMKTKVSAPVR